MDEIVHQCCDEDWSMSHRLQKSVKSLSRETPGEKQVMFNSLFQHRDLPEGRADMGDADLIRLWVAVASIPCVTDLYQHVSAYIGLSPAGRVH